MTLLDFVLFNRGFEQVMGEPTSLRKLGIEAEDIAVFDNEV